ncbi:MAG: twin transmembrane helix small protein [Devosiaceae bacterium]|nr:twin transmembrane helix small protein [Devosiaceae bacterium MH13]
MSTFLQILTFVALGAVAIVLLLGLANMLRGGTSSRSQQLMRMRVLFQAIAIVVVMVTVWFIGRS